MRALPLLLAAIVALAGPAAAVPTLTATPPSAAAVDAEQVAFGQWLGRLTAIEQPVQDSLVGLQSGIQSILHAADVPSAAAVYRPTIVRLLATIDQVDARLAGIDTPEFPALDIPPELRPAAVKRAILQMNAATRTGFQDYIPVLDAVARRDLGAARAASVRTMASMRQMLELQLLLARATQAPFPQDRSIWNMLEMSVLYARTTLRIANAYTEPRSVTAAAAFSGDLRGLADELDRTAEMGTPKAAAEIAQANTALAEAERRGEPSLAAIMRRRIIVLTEGRAFFPLSRDFAVTLRRLAADTAGRPLTDRYLVEAFLRLAPIRDRLFAVVASLRAARNGS